MNDRMNEKLEQVEEYFRIQASLLKLKAADKAAGLASKSIAASVVGTLAVLGFIFLNVGAAFLIARYFEDPAPGFLLLGGLYLLLTLIFAVFRGPMLVNPLRNRLIRSLLEEEQP